MVAKTDLKARLLDLVTGTLELTRDGGRDIGSVCDVLQIVKEDPGFAARLLGEKAVVLVAPEKARTIPGSDLALTLDDCEQFLREFCGITGYAVDVHQVPAKPEGDFWPDPCHSALTYDRLAELIVEKGVPHYDWVPDFLRRQVDRSFDARKAEDGNYVLYTPAGIEAIKARPEFKGVSYLRLWEDKAKVLTCREAVILWLFVSWKTGGKTKLDRKGWTRTGSRSVLGFGVYVLACVDRLRVYWNDPALGYPCGSARSAVSA